MKHGGSFIDGKLVHETKPVTQPSPPAPPPVPPEDEDIAGEVE